MIRPTQTGVMFAVLSVLIYFASLLSQSSLLLIPVGIVLGCALLNIVLARRAVRALAIEAPPLVHLAEGERMSQPWKVENRSSRAVSLVQVESRGEVLLRVPFLAPGEALNVAPQVAFSRRGVHGYARMLLVCGYPFGLVAARQPLEMPGEVVVYPAIYAVPAPAASGFDVVTGGRFKGQRRLAGGAFFAGVRPLQPGDALKQIHWKSSAKGRGLMVKTFEEELSGRVAIIMDAGSAGEGQRLDECARMVASLAFAALDAGDHVEWIDLSHLALVLTPPSADGHELLERLARLEMAAGCLSHHRLEEALKRISRRAAVVLGLTEWNPAVAEVVVELMGQGRAVTVCLPATVPPPRTGALVLRYGPGGLIDGETSAEEMAS